MNDIEDVLTQQARDAVALLESISRSRELTQHEQTKLACARRVLEEA